MSTLTLRAAPPERLDFLNINPAALSRLSQGEAERLEIGTTRTGVRLGDCFAVSLDGSDTLTLEGGHERLDRVGASLSAGTIRVTGDVGQRLGAGMAGGRVTVTGHAGPYAASGATGGTTALEILNILEQFPAAACGYDTAAGLHVRAESVRRAFADRFKHIGDPEVVGDTFQFLASKEHARAAAREG